MIRKVKEFTLNYWVEQAKWSKKQGWISNVMEYAKSCHDYMNYWNDEDEKDIPYKAVAYYRTHKLKIKWQYGSDVYKRIKTFELRKNDRFFKVGDSVKFKVVDKQNYNCEKDIKDFESKKYLITYVLKNCPNYGLKDGYCIFGIKEE